MLNIWFYLYIYYCLILHPLTYIHDLNSNTKQIHFEASLHQSVDKEGWRAGVTMKVLHRDLVKRQLDRSLAVCVVHCVESLFDSPRVCFETLFKNRIGVYNQNISTMYLANKSSSFNDSIFSFLVRTLNADMQIIYNNINMVLLDALFSYFLLIESQICYCIFQFV